MAHPARIVSQIILGSFLLLGMATASTASDVDATDRAADGSGKPQTDGAPIAGDADAPKPVPAPAASDPAALKAPDFTVTDLKGGTIHLADLLAKGPVYVNFWTTWCGPCKREMPELDRIHKTYRDRGFAVVAVAQDEARSAGKVKPYIESNKFEFFAATDPTKSVGNAYNVRAYPTSFLVKQDGTIGYFAQGYLPGDEKKIEGLVRGLLGLETGQEAPGAAK